MTFRKDASKVVKITKRMIDNKLISPPRWLPAAEKFPNNDNFVRTPSSFTIDAPLPFEGDKVNKPAFLAFSSGKALKGKPNKKKLQFVSPIPPKIVYPEDELRREFFKDHPFELVRPISLVEKDGLYNNSWSNLLSSDKSKRVSAEDVIKFQLYLMTQGLSKEEAYEAATKQLARHRIAEEHEVELANVQAKHFGAKLNQDFLQNGIENEEKQLNKSREVIELTSALRKSQEFTSEKSFKTDEAPQE